MKIQRAVGDWDKQEPYSSHRQFSTDNRFGRPDVTDCSMFTTSSMLQPASVPLNVKPAVRWRFQLHYRMLPRQLVLAEARRMILSSDRHFGNMGTGSDGIVEKFTQLEIPVFAHTSNKSDVTHVDKAIDHFNQILSNGTSVRLKRRDTGPGEKTGGLSGIHIYFGSHECIWRVVKEQVGVDRKVIANAATFELSRITGITLRKGLQYNGLPTGRLHQSFIIVTNLTNADYKQHVLEHEILHALGIKGHPKHFLWSRMSSVGGTIDPEIGITAFDRRVLRFLYSELREGGSPAYVDEQITRWWSRENNIPVERATPCLRGLIKDQKNSVTVKGEQLAKRILCKAENTS